MKEKLLGKTLGELKAVAVDCGLKPFAGSQLAQWLYVRKVRSFDSMTNISKAARETLAARYEIGVGDPAGSAVSSDGDRKSVV